jgi:hypothetical protein
MMFTLQDKSYEVKFSEGEAVSVTVTTKKPGVWRTIWKAGQEKSGKVRALIDIAQEEWERRKHEHDAKP